MDLLALAQGWLVEQLGIWYWVISVPTFTASCLWHFIVKPARRRAAQKLNQSLNQILKEE